MKIFEKWPGVEDDEAHALVDPLGDAVDGGVVDLGVGLVAPPEEDVGVLEAGGGEAVLGLVEGGGGGVDAGVGVQGGGDGGVDAVGVDAADGGVLALVDELVPDDGSDHGGSPPRALRWAPVRGEWRGWAGVQGGVGCARATEWARAPGRTCIWNL